MRTVVLSLLPLALLGGIFAGHANAAPLYGATGTGGGTGTLVSIDPLTGAYTVIGPLNDALGQNYRLTGLAFHPITGVLYGSSNNTSPTNPQSLVIVDPLTGLVTLVGSYGQDSQTMADLTFTPDGTLYGWLEPSDDDLFSINTATGQATLVGESGIGTYGSGLAANSAGVVYFAGEGTGGRLFVVDTITGGVAPVATLDSGPAGLGSAVGAMAFSPAGTLYATVASPGGRTPAYLVTIDPQTGQITTIGQSIDRLDAIAFGLGAPGTEIPEPATLSLLVGGCLMGWLLRRRQTA
jgi:hypothetical protein